MKKQADHAEVIAVGWSAFLMMKIFSPRIYSRVQGMKGLKK